MKLSIITINYNNAEGLSKTIKSVIDQTWDDFEYLIIDGGSSDGSLELIHQYKKELCYWVSEPDQGIFQAMNKGIRKAKGEFLLMLNSGDVLYNNFVLSQVFEVNKIDADILYGDVFRETQGNIFSESTFPDQLDLNFLHNGSISHQAAFIRRNLHHKIGLYDEDLKLTSDWSFFILAICKFNATYKHLDSKIAVCNCDGVTCSPSNLIKIMKEREGVLKVNFPIFVEKHRAIFEQQKLGILQRVSDAFKHFLLRGKLKIKTISKSLLSSSDLV